jgi:signal transduction histidine kinase
MSILTVIIAYTKYEREINIMQTHTLSQMHICSLELTCSEFKIDFVSKKEYTTYMLYQKPNKGLYAYFPILNSEKHLLELSLSEKDYKKKVKELRKEIFLYLIPIIFTISILSILFSLYSLYPLRNALKLTEEFIKDILHDFNTPLASLRLNSSMLHREFGENKKVKRIENSVNTILNLQENLTFYLHNHEMQKTIFSPKKCVESAILTIEKSYEDVHFIINIPSSLQLQTNQKAMMRILDNLINNAGKYNQKNGKVEIKYNKEKKELLIMDTGKGIKHPELVFKRFYTEQDRGLGIGLHIVQKLCNELNIAIHVKSTLQEGTIFYLNIKNLIYN